MADFWTLYQIAVKDGSELQFARDWQRSERRFPPAFALNLTCRECHEVFRDAFRLLVPICLRCAGSVPGESLHELKVRILALGSVADLPPRLPAASRREDVSPAVRQVSDTDAGMGDRTEREDEWTPVRKR
jgi:hypothetical protein